MDNKIELNEEKQQSKKQKLQIENEVETKQNSLLDIFDTNILSQIFIQLTIPIISEKEDYQFCFFNCTAFASTSKIFNLVTKQSKFSTTIFDQEKIENTNFNIYLKLNYILQQQEITNTIFDNKEELLNEILIYSSEDGIYDIIPTLILNGADVECKHQELPALYCSCEQGYYKTSKILIKYNANINFTEEWSGSLLHLACGSGKLKLVKYLIKLGLNINEKNYVSETPIFTACRSGKIKIVKYLIEEKNYDFNVKDSNDKSILWNAYTSDNLELIDYLLSLGLDIDYKDNGGHSVLYFTSIFRRDLELTKHLILRGADLRLKYEEDRNILEVAKARKDKNQKLKLIIEELEKYF